jgi:predicted TIM-barrel fold metal-dependent hydrolase
VTVIDAVSNLLTPEIAALRPDWSRQHMGGRFGVAQETMAGVPLAQQVERMDQAGVDRAVLLAPIMGPRGWPGHWALDARYVLDAVAAHPDRFRCQVGIDPLSDVRGVRELRSLVRDDGVVGAHFYPHWFDMAPDDPRAYPLYAACEELGIPVQLQVGHALKYTGSRPVYSLGEPWRLEAVACDFPELKILGSHVGWPWTEEMVGVATTYANVYLVTDSYAPRHWGPALDRFAREDTAGKVLFGTMWPSIPWDRALREIAEKELPPAAYAGVVGGNAAAVFGWD